jgi:hypothetical protein
MPSLDTSSSVVPTEDYTPSMPNIDFDSLNPAEPEVPVGTPNVDYLSSILNEAKQIKDLREQASVAAKQELDPEQSIATVLMSAIPALLGLAVSGKRGLASAGLVSGPAAMKYAEERRNDRKNEAAALNQQATALQQALQLGMRERGVEERARAALKQTDELRRLQILATKANTDAVVKGRQETAEDARKAKQEELQVADLKLPEGVKVSPSEAKAVDTARADYSNLFNNIDRLQYNWDKLSREQQAGQLARILLAIKSEGIDNGGAAFSRLEANLMGATLPKISTLGNVNYDTLFGELSQKMSRFDPKAALSDLREAYLSRFQDKIGKYQIDPEGSFGMYQPIFDKLSEEKSKYRENIAAAYGGNTTSKELTNKYGKDAANVFGKVGVTVGR